MKVFKLRNKLIGEYHCGGYTPCWGFGGKSYDKRGPLVAIVSRWKWCRENQSWANYYPQTEDLEIVEFELIETEGVVYQAVDLIK